MNRPILLWLFWGTLVFGACNALKTGSFTGTATTRDPIPLHRYQSYAWAKQTKPPSALEVENLDSIQFDGWVREEVDRQMTAKGLELVPYSEAELILSYYFFLREDVKEVYNNAPYAQEWYQRGIYIPGGRVVSEMESTLYINMVDVRTEESIWLGWGKKKVKPRDLSRVEIQKSVGAIIDLLRTEE